MLVVFTDKIHKSIVLFVQIALIPGAKEPTLDNQNIATETERIMGNLGAILAAAGCSFSDVYRSRIYITDMGIFSEVNAVYGRYFTQEEEPVRECVMAAPPLDGARVEISMDAYLPE